MSRRWGLVLGGGGRNGAFSVGALYRLVSDLGMTFDFVSGASTGALMAGPALLGQVELLNDLYCGGVCERDLLRRRWLPWGLLRGALADTRPLRRLIEAATDIEGLIEARLEGRAACVSTVNLRTGRLTRAWSDGPYLENWTDWVLASASLPVLMDPVEIAGDHWVDGGLKDAVPVQPLLGLGLDGIIVIRTAPPWSHVLEESPGGVLGVLERTIDVMAGEVARRDLPVGGEAGGTKVVVIGPDRHLGDSMAFDRAAMEDLWFEGYDAAAATVEAELTGGRVL